MPLLAANDDGLWLAGAVSPSFPCQAESVVRIDPRTGRVTRVATVPALDSCFGPEEQGIAFFRGAVYFLDLPKLYRVAVSIKALDANGSGDLGSVAVGIAKAADLGARVINLSLGGPLGLDVLQEAVDYAESKGAVVVAASGNSGSSSPFYPAGYPTVLSVAGTDQTDHLYPWSDYGTWVRVSAPGCNVAPLVTGGYGEFCGTSSATPSLRDSRRLRSLRLPPERRRRS